MRAELHPSHLAGVPPLRRHQLARLSTAGWQHILARHRDDPAAACLQHWAQHNLPLVVTRQRQAASEQGTRVALGLAAPTCWGRRPLALQVDLADISALGEFPTLEQVLDLLPGGDRPALQALVHTLQGLGVPARVYGSAGWQRLTGLGYLHERSDLDLWLAVGDARQADAAAAPLAACNSHLRLDGELMLADGSAIAWREWQAWRAGRCRQVLVKRLHGAALEADPAALADDGAGAAAAAIACTA
jgi:phosphoribosyl-dephospho-CoA transferase